MAENDKKQQEEAAKKHAEEQKKREEQAQQNKQTQQPEQSQHSKKAGGGTVGGAMTTYGSPKAKMPDPEPVVLEHDEIKQLAGDIGRGELAHIRLNEHGDPTGQAFRDIPEADDVTAAVYGTPMVQFDELVTPSGAPITKMMNPEPKLWDAGMLARNPPPKMTDRQKQFHQVGGGVVNQPVTA
jgi:hypothetical protein